MFAIGAVSIPIKISDRTTTATGLFITKRAVCAHRPSSFGVIEDLRIKPLSIFLPMTAKIAGSPIIAPITAIVTTDTPA